MAYARRITGREGEGNKGTGMGDPLVVDARILAEVLKRVVQQHEFENRPEEADKMTSRVRLFSGQQFLQQETGLSEKRVRLLLTGQGWVTLGTADRVLTALGMTYLLTDGTLPALPNPRWSQERWVAWKNMAGGCEPEVGDEHFSGVELTGRGP